jgi:hypothetical protein
MEMAHNRIAKVRIDRLSPPDEDDAQDDDEERR